jgi:hypothetical protein
MQLGGFPFGRGGVLGVSGVVEPLGISGGTISTPTGYKVATFTAPGTLVVTGSGTLYYEYVAGGGAAGGPSTGTGGARGGGGGAGEIKRGSLSVTSGSYAIVIGAAGGFVSPSPGSDGGNSTALGVTALGGGGGGGGAASATVGDRRGGGGGGASGAGAAATAAGSTGIGGAGSPSICPGVSATYAVGGNGYLGVTPTAPTAPGSGGRAGATVNSGTSGVAGIVHFWMVAE